MAFTYPVVPIGAIFQVTLRMTWSSQQLRNTYHWRVEQNSLNRTVEIVAGRFNDAFNVAVTGLYATHKALRDPSCDHYDTQIQMIAPARYVAIGTAGAGVGGGPVATPNLQMVAAVITRRSVEATRSGVGSVHIPAYVDGDLTTGNTDADGSWTDAYVIKIGDHGNSFLGLTDLTDGILVRPIIYHRPPASINYSYIESFSVVQEPRVMQRRVLGRGI